MTYQTENSGYVGRSDPQPPNLGGSGCTAYHVPVLLTESVDGLDIQPGGVYVDVTFGGGGHSREILRRLNGKGHLYSFDQDSDAQKNIAAINDGGFNSAGNNCLNREDNGGRNSKDNNDNFTFVLSNFRYLKNWMRYYGVEQLDGVLADLGVSSHHFDEAERGFSFRFDAPLDMRMNQKGSLTAAQIVNSYSEEQLADVFYLYGELKQARRLAATLVKQRQQQPITTTGQLLQATEQFFARQREKKEVTKMFQALRIEVNQEMEALRDMLNAACQLLRPGGRLSVITYHSLEDRIVKNVMRAGNADGHMEQDFYGRIIAPLHLIYNKTITPTAEELEANPRSRSAKLRVAEKN